MVHYHLILEMAGPLQHIWSMRAEQKHRESKLTANVSCSFKNMLQTLMFKNQLRIVHTLKSVDSNPIEFGPLYYLPEFFQNFSVSHLHSTTWINLHGTKYKPNFIMITSWNEELPVFGIIKKIVVYKEGEFYFILESVETEYFSRHLHAFKIKKIGTKFCFSFKDLHSHLPSILCINNKSYYIRIRHSV